MKADKRHAHADWYKREKKQGGKKQPFKFKRKEWKYLEKCDGVERSLDKLFGVELRSKIRFIY